MVYPEVLFPLNIIIDLTYKGSLDEDNPSGFCRAKLLKRSSESSQAAVQLTEDLSVHKLSFDQISDFVGELGEEE